MIPSTVLGNTSICPVYSNASADLQKAPLLSIVTISYNSGKLIKTNLASMLLQEVEHGDITFEHLLIDGKSTDSTLNFMQQYAEQAGHPVRVFSQSDRGISHAFNIGLSQSRGAWIWFLNSDDFLAAACTIQNLCTHIKNLSSNERMIIGAMLLTDKNVENKLGVMMPEQEKVRAGMYLPHPSLIAAREVFDACGDFSESYKVAMDYDWLMRVLHHKMNYSSRIRLIDDFLVIFRKCGISNTRQDISWRENCSVQLLYYGWVPATFRYFYALCRREIVALMNKSKITRKCQSFSNADQNWINSVLEVSRTRF